MSARTRVCTDGGCSPNPGTGGWAVAVESEGEWRIAASGRDAASTNNRMELTAAIAAIEMHKDSKIELRTDSKYVRDGIRSWISSWKRNGWRTSQNEPVKNCDLWKRLDALNCAADVDWQWVRGHDGDPGNELADQAACREIELAAAEADRQHEDSCGRNKQHAQVVSDRLRVCTDGGCSPNPGSGGWAVAVETESEWRVAASGRDAETTNNRMELTAAIAAIEMHKDSRIELRTDSRYVREGITTWISSWKRNDWRTSQDKPVKNCDLWKRLDALNCAADVDWQWVRGHDGDPGNELADQAVGREIALAAADPGRREAAG